MRLPKLKLSILVKSYYLFMIVSKCVWITIGIAVLYFGFYFFNHLKGAPTHVENILANADDLTKNGSALVFRTNQHLTDDWFKNFDNNINTSVVTAQQTANDYSRVARATTDLLITANLELKNGSKNFNAALAAIIKIAPNVDSVVLNTGQRIDQLLDHSKIDLDKLTDSSKQFIDTGEQTVSHFDQLMTGEHFQNILSNGDQMTANGARITGTVADKLPVFFDNTNETMGHIAGISGDIQIYADRAVKPQTFKEKLFSAAGGFILKQSPFIITTAFKR